MLKNFIQALSIKKLPNMLHSVEWMQLLGFLNIYNNRPFSLISH